MATTPNATYPIRYCTGGCSKGEHHAHVYSTDPVDGNLGKPHLCPGNLSEARQWLDGETGEPLGMGYIQVSA